MTEIAIALNITIQTVSNWEAGYREIKLALRQTLALCFLFNCTLEELVKELEND